MASRSLAVSGSRMAAAAESSSAMSSKKTTKTVQYTTDSSGNVSKEVVTHIDSSSDASSASMRRLEERIRIIQEDLESEQSLRRRIEKEKQGLQVQIISLSERLTEAEGGAESQLDINRKREAEMAKLRKLLEDSHMESETTILTLKKKHQEAMMELQEQIESVSRSKETIVKQKSKMQTEISELLAHIEVLSSEKLSMKKIVEKLEININEYNVKIQEMNKQILQVSSEKTRLQQDNSDTVKRMNELKHSIDAAGLDKNKLAMQLKDFQENIDALNRAKAQAENKVRTLEQSVKTLNIEIEEYKEVRINMEKLIVTLKTESADWKKKYDTEARLRIDDVESLKKKYTVQMAEIQDRYDDLLSKLKAMESQKNKLAQEIEIIVKQFESSQVTIKELNVRCAASDKKCDELAVKLREMTNLYEKADRDNKARAAELVKLGNNMDRCMMENDGLKRDKAKLEDDNSGLKAELDALKARLHAAEQENRKLAHDREELARAFKDSDTAKVRAESRVKELEAELKKLRADAEARLNGAAGDAAAMKQKLMAEIEVLTKRLMETETRLKVEVEKIKKKMSVTITELEMSLDAANKANNGLQNAGKAQASKIMELTSILEKTNQKLVVVSESADANAKKLAIADQELHAGKRGYAELANAKKVLETKLAEYTTKITEITNINTSLSSIKVKLEKDLAQVTHSYEDMARELKLADDRANKAAHDAQHFEGLLREETTKIQRIDQAKKALETQVKSLTIRMEEIETTAVTSSKRTIQKMEQRIEELEMYLAKEKTMHVETTSVLHKKERSVKELLLQSEEDRKNILILQESLERLNEKIKMYKRQLEEQESISNSNIMRVKKFQRELESAESRAEEAESCLNSFRSQQRVFAAAAESRSREVAEVEREVVVKKNVTNINSSSANVSRTAIQTQSSTEAAAASSSSSAMQASSSRAMQASSSSSAMQASSSSSAMQASSSRAYRAGSTYSRAGSMARATSVRAGSIGRAGSMLRY